MPGFTRLWILFPVPDGFLVLEGIPPAPLGNLQINKRIFALNMDFRKINYSFNSKYIKINT